MFTRQASAELPSAWPSRSAEHGSCPALALSVASPGHQLQIRARPSGYPVTEVGIRQFLDADTRIPTAGNIHQVAQAIAPESRVVYVDYDPIVLAHGRALLVSKPQGRSVYTDADMREPARKP